MGGGGGGGEGGWRYVQRLMRINILINILYFLTECHGGRKPKKSCLCPRYFDFLLKRREELGDGTATFKIDF